MTPVVAAKAAHHVDGTATAGRRYAAHQRAVSVERCGARGQHQTVHTAALSCRGVRRSSGDVTVVDDVWFDVLRGEAFGLIGPDTAGVSAIVAMVCGLLTADEGTVLLHGRPVDGLDVPAVQRCVGYVAQDAVGLPSGTVVENLRFWARVAGLPIRIRAARTAEVLGVTGLDEHADDPVGRCTSGVLRQLSLAVALLHRPRLLVLDRPVARIDPRSRVRLLSTLAGLRDSGTALLLTGDTVEDVTGLCGRVGSLEGGRLRGVVRPGTTAASATCS
jgi:ABC-type multidrug transport system ATPase subunit